MKVKNQVSIPLPSPKPESIQQPLAGRVAAARRRVHRREGEGFEAYIVKNNEKHLPRGIRHSTDMHTGAQSAKKDVISTKPQKGRASRGPKKAQRSTTEPHSQVTPAICRRPGTCYLV